jgi:hypothetical protein
MPLRTCAKCGRPGQGRYCPEHQRQENARRTNKVTRHGYKSAHWQAVRKQRLELAGYVCELKLAGCTNRVTHVHLPARYEGQHGQPTSTTAAPAAPPAQALSMEHAATPLGGLMVGRVWGHESDRVRSSGRTLAQAAVLDPDSRALRPRTGLESCCASPCRGRSALLRRCRDGACA